LTLAAIRCQSQEPQNEEAVVSRMWEYNVVDLATTDRELIRDELNQADELGWELVSVALAPKLADPVLVGVFRKPYAVAEADPLVAVAASSAASSS
jgi:hypothetical protein